MGSQTGGLLPPRSQQVPPIEPRPSLFGPAATRLRRRAFALWFILCALGSVAPALAALGFAVSPALQAFGWGLWLPGAGFVAVGGWFALLFPVALLLVILGFWLWVLSGAVAIPGAIWLGAAIGAYFAAGTDTFQYTWIVVPASAIVLFGVYLYQHRHTYAVAAQLGRRRAAELPDMLAELDAAAQPQPDARARELTPDELSASRYLFDLALQPLGSLDGFTRLDNFQLAALRYQLNYIGYGLSLLQCKYLPNFHGYLNRAQQFAIESLTLPEVCSYWTLEALWGLFTWNPDPIHTRDNIMLTGLSLPAITAYAANTGDRRYEQAQCLRFRPLRWLGLSYGHDTKSFIESILKNWRHSAYVLYPCEPHWVFPICNGYAWCGLVPYDRVNATKHAASSYGHLIENLEREFLTPDGGVHPELSSLIGISPFWAVAQMQFDNLMSVAQVYNAIHPGLAKRWYAMGRHDFIVLGPNGLAVKGRPWDECVDFGNYHKNPGMALASIALAAREHGDDRVAEAAFAKADELLSRVQKKGVLAYEGMSASANTNLAVARWARRDDWHDLINVGPSRAGFAGPILADCAYPEVLVARAMSEGADLDLVLYNGADPGDYRILIERLRPETTYEVVGARPPRFTAPSGGEVELQVELRGRTHVHIRPASLHA